MIRNLLGAGDRQETADFVVIGAGTVGLPVGVELAKRLGKRVIVLESGAEEQKEDTHPLNEVVQLSHVYKGAEQGRFRGLGGTSSRWGGALIPFQPADLDQRHWPIALADLEPFVPRVEALFGLEKGPYTDPAFPFPLTPDFVNRLAKWPPFKSRNVYSLLASDCETLDNLEIWINASVTGIKGGSADQPVDIIAQSAGGDRITIRADRLIVAAGAIETSRLALLIDQQNGGVVSAVSPALGRYFSDHLSVPVARIDVSKSKRLNRIIGFRFGGGGAMRNIRFELSNGTALRQALPPSFTHIAFETEKAGGFDALRELFRYLQMRRVPPPGVFVNLVKNLPWLARAVWWRFFEKRLLFPDGAIIQAHVVTEQVPTAESRITLSTTRFDQFGIPLAEIDWKVTGKDTENLHMTTDAVETMWLSTEFAALGGWKRRDAQSIERDMIDGGGIFHPTGSTRMGRSAEEGVVDHDLRLFSLPRIQLLSTSVLPTGGGANPTMMLMLLGMRCVEKHTNAAG
jgi:choline dehydrogenase-like flavoprotein